MITDIGKIMKAIEAAEGSGAEILGVEGDKLIVRKEYNLATIHKSMEEGKCEIKGKKLYWKRD